MSHPLLSSAGLVAVAGNCAVVLPWHAFCTGLTGGFFFYGGRLLLWYVWVRAWVHVLGCVCACACVRVGVPHWRFFFKWQPLTPLVYGWVGEREGVHVSLSVDVCLCVCVPHRRGFLLWHPLTPLL